MNLLEQLFLFFGTPANATNEEYQGHRCPRYVNPNEPSVSKLFYAYPD